MAKRDSAGFGDGLEATVTTPEGEAVSGMEVVDEPQHRGATLDYTVEKREKGYGVFVSVQDAPLTIRNVTWYDTEEVAHENVAAYLRTVTQSQLRAALGV